MSDQPLISITPAIVPTVVIQAAVPQSVVLTPQGAPGRPGKDGRDGVDGAPGTPGRDGRDGVDGAPGRDGVDGAPGRDGVDGAPGTPGRDGVDGAPGTPGRDGTNGTNGTNGKSAYELWLAAGNVGTQADFLASLKGAPGTPATRSADVNESTAASYTYVTATDNGNIRELNTATQSALILPKTALKGENCLFVQTGAGGFTISVETGGTLKGLSASTGIDQGVTGYVTKNVDGQSAVWRIT